MQKQKLAQVKMQLTMLNHMHRKEDDKIKVQKIESI
jgi:hypothetical protein